MEYTHMKVDKESKAKFKQLAESHKLSMLQLFKHKVDKDYNKLLKTSKNAPKSVKAKGK